MWLLPIYEVYIAESALVGLGFLHSGARNDATSYLRGCSMASNRSCRSHCGSSVASAVTLAVAAVNGRRVLDGVCSATVTAVSANDYIVQ